MALEGIVQETVSMDKHVLRGLVDELQYRIPLRPHIALQTLAGMDGR